jgi:hypothetical protein
VALCVALRLRVLQQCALLPQLLLSVWLPRRRVPALACRVASGGCAALWPASPLAVGLALWMQAALQQAVWLALRLQAALQQAVWLALGLLACRQAVQPAGAEPAAPAARCTVASQGER